MTTTTNDHHPTRVTYGGQRIIRIRLTSCISKSPLKSMQKSCRFKICRTHMEKWGDILNLEFSLKIQHNPREVPGVINVNIAEFLVEHWTMHWSWRKGVFWKWYQLSGDMKELGLIKLITKNANYRLPLVQVEYNYRQPIWYTFGYSNDDMIFGSIPISWRVPYFSFVCVIFVIIHP